MHCSVIEHGYDVIEFSNCSTEERDVSRVLLCSLKTKWHHNHMGSITEQSTTSCVLTALEHSRVLYFPNMENAVHYSLVMHGFHNGKWLILCSKFVLCTFSIQTHSVAKWIRACSSEQFYCHGQTGFKVWAPFIQLHSSWDSRQCLSGFLKSLHFILAQSENSITATACPLKFSWKEHN